MDLLGAAVARLMAEVADEVIVPRFRALAGHEIFQKSPGDLVTVADHESEARLTEGLLALLPTARVVGEEAVAADPAVMANIGSGTVWIVDPLDGTMNFTEGKSPFAVMVALAVDGDTMVGWIFDPITRRLCMARRGEGAWIDGQRITARASGGALPLAAISTMFIPDARRRDIEARTAGRLAIGPIPRCAGEQYPRVALGQNDIALFERTLPWDHAPGALFLEEAGGRVARPDGSPYRLDDGRTGMIAAASPALWDEAARILFD